ncbi:uncharacterized protein LOC105929975 isoform X1 [Fundulus heteroclitus]|uniref:uncharacterized protein LOC105929975 isoform X1 n=1 Tax=Fundulus heteroclitus TaxID=8078 RepID=UPI00165B2048|nr:uncharacterized protein LOC105929975 isoform X1 [Fundulus heteroclitus]
MDSKDMAEHTEHSSGIFKHSQDEYEAYYSATAQIKRYYSLMDDEGPDDVFIQPPSLPPCKALLLPTEGSTHATPTDSGMTLPTEAADATNAKANPCSLDRHHGEKQLMAARNELVEEITAMQLSVEPMDNTLLSNDMNSRTTDYQEQTSMGASACLMERCHDKTGKAEQNNTSGDEESNEESNHGPKPFNEEENQEEEREKNPERIYSNVDENLEHKTNPDQDQECDKNDKDISCLDETDFKLSRTVSDLSENNDFLTSDPSELCEFTKNKMEETPNDFPAEVSGDNEEHDGTRSLDDNLTRSELTIGKESEEIVENRRIATDIQQGEQLLQRLQMVQLRHDDIQNTSQEIIKVVNAEEEGGFRSEGEDVGAGGMDVTAKEDEEEGGSKRKEVKTNLTENEDSENNDREHTPYEERASLSTPSGMPEHNQINKRDEDESLDDYSEILIPSTLPLHGTREMSSDIPFISVGHRLSAAETSMEKQLQEAARAKQNLQRAGGVLNLADNPDVLEIPFKTDVSLETLLIKACTTQPSQWQFSEKKMQKEISQEIQRELVLVNQGKIPGEYCKGEVRQLKETKLLFEAFQQVNIEGPTRQRKLPTSAMKGHVYPSVLERTRSLETFSLRTSPVMRAHSLRLYNSATLKGDRSPETLRAKSPTGGSRDKTRLSPYSKYDKPLRLHRSMDSISSECSTSAVEFRGKTKERQESPFLGQNPFFKLRPAMALQPEVEKDIREAKEREEELRRQRCTLYGEDKPKSEDEEKYRYTKTFKSDVKLQSRGKLERLWPPPSKKDQKTSGEVQQEAKVHRAGGQKAPLWQLWESGLINGKTSDEKK